MYKECKEYLIQTLQDAGIQKRPIESMKILRTCMEIRLSAVIFESEKLEKDKQKRIYQDGEGTKKRRKYYTREITFKVIVGEAGDDEAEAIYERLLVQLTDGFYVNGNYVEVIPEDVQWYAENDSVLRSKCSLELTVRFIGGVYKDWDMKKIKSGSTIVERREHGEQE